MTKKIMRTLCFTLSVFFLFLPICVFGSEDHGVTADEILNSNNFVPLTAEEFEEAKLIFECGTNEQKLEAVNRAQKDQAGTYAWNQTYIEDLGNGTYRMQGYVQFSHTENGMTAVSSLLAQMSGSNTFGYTWSYYSSEGVVAPLTDDYTFTGKCESLLLSANRLSLNTIGYFEISHSQALPVGVDLDIADFSYTSGVTTYYRHSIAATHVETLNVRG